MYVLNECYRTLYDISAYFDRKYWLTIKTKVNRKSILVLNVHNKIKYRLPMC